jgi:glucosamine--fructose-6-phosphate aminotransferase (isomerizing)
MTVSRLPIQNLNTINEILSQPGVWRKVLAELPGNAACKSFLPSASACNEWLFVGCGTSYYLAEAAAAIWTMVTGLRARAVPASEILLFADLLQLDAAGLQAIVISRSGKTSEAVRAAEVLNQRSVPAFGITCVANSELTKVCESSLALPAADEQSLVMTRSFTAMLLALTYLAASLGKRNEYSAAFDELSSRLGPQVEAYSDRLESFVAEHSFDDFIYLGQGPFFPIAREGCLKITEMSCSYAQAYHTLEFRHGPKSVVSQQTCLTFFLSESGLEAESEVLGEMKALGGKIVGICNRSTDAVRRSCDLVIEFNLAVPEPLLAAASIVPAQLLGFHAAIKKGLNPDEPKNLSRVVILD